MNDEQSGQNPGSGTSGPGGDKLDQWIQQNLHKDLPSPQKSGNQTPAQEPKSEQTQKPASAHPAHGANKAAVPANPAPHQAAKFHKPQHPGHNPRYGKTPPRRHFQGTQKVNVPNKFHKTAGPSHSTSINQTTNKSMTNNQNANTPKKKFFGLFGAKKSNNSNNNSRQTHRSEAEVHTNKSLATQNPPTILNSTILHSQKFHGKLRCIMVGGLDEVGKNCMILEYGNDIILIDLGFQFPEEDMLGVDYIIPDLSYLDDKIDRIRAIVITHGHLDHVGAIPYVIAKLKFPPIYATKLTNGLIQKRLEEFGLAQQTKLINVTKDDVIQLGQFNISFFHVNHSIPDAVGVVVKTPAGNIVHTGDFKFDLTPSGDQAPPDFARLAQISTQNISALFIDSTNALKPGYTVSEKKVGASLEKIIKDTDGRILIASFSSQIGRIQQIIDYAKRHGRTIFTSGRSLADNIFIASKLGYLKVPQGIIQDIYKMGKIAENKVIILSTGSQGEATSALTRMALEEHPKVKVKKGDTVVLSSSPIPGNERAITTVTNNLCKLGVRIINNQIMDVHTSGHAQQEDLKLMINLIKAKYVVPVHGEYYMRYGNKELAMHVGYAEKNAVLVENGAILEIENGEVKVAKETVENKYILVDGLGVGDIGAQVMMDRQVLAENGVLILVITVDEKSHKIKKDVDVISRGFIYMQQSEELVKAISVMAGDAYRRVVDKRGADTNRGDIKKYIKETVDKLVHQKIERHPLVLPIIIEQ